MNWGKGITIALALFITFIVVLGTILMQQDVDLVAEDYYQQEIDYEAQIKAESNAKKLDITPEISQDADHLLVKVPNGNFKNVVLHLKRPNNSKQDMTFNIEGTQSFIMDKQELESGQYDVTLRYTFEGKQCQQKSNIYIQK